VASSARLHPRGSQDRLALASRPIPMALVQERQLLALNGHDQAPLALSASERKTDLAASEAEIRCGVQGEGDGVA
jgi:hypothetical protein